MRLPKHYGESSVARCPFCGEAAYAKNCQGVPVCRAHVGAQLPDLKCVCGGWLDQRESKFGTFYTCMRCGPVSFSRMMETNGDKIREAARKGAQPAQAGAPQPASQPRGAQSRGGTLRERIKEKLARGEALTPDELDFL